MSKFSKVKRSRNQWKKKATERADENRYIRKELARIKKERDLYKKLAREGEKKLEEKEQCSRIQTVTEKKDLVYLCLQLFIQTRISFRAVSRVLKVLVPYLGLKKGPCHQTVINWINRLSISRIQMAPSVIGVSHNDSPPFCLMTACG